jgi:cysteine-S-conjugate beta-lyase
MPRQDGGMSPFDYDRLSEGQLRARRTHKWNAFDDDVLSLELAELDVPTAPGVMDAIRDAVDRECFGYPMFADTALAEATASWCRRRYGWAIDARCVHDVPDVLRGIELALEALVPPGPIVLPTPAYPPFFDVIAVTGRRAVEVPMVPECGRLVLDLDGIDQALGAGCAAVLLCNPQNPTGRAFDADELTALSAVVARHGGRVVADEIHAPLVYDGRRHVPYASVGDAAATQAVTMHAASKAWNLAGLKCAQVVLTSPADHAAWSRIPRLRRMGASTIGITASVAAYESGEEWLDGLLVHLERNRDLLIGGLVETVPGARPTWPEATYLAWVDFAGCDLEVEPFDHFLADARVALRAGRSFGVGFSMCARLNFGTTRDVLARAVGALGSALAGHRGSIGT